MGIEDWKENGNTLIESAKENADWWIQHGAIYDEEAKEWIPIYDEKVAKILKLAVIGFAEQFTALAEFERKDIK